MMARLTSYAALMTGGMLLASFCAPASAGGVAIVTTKVIYPGEIISPQALEEVPVTNRTRDLSTVATFVEQVDGKVAKRTLLPGHFIDINAVRDAYLVEQGAAVQVMFVQGPLTISATAMTLQPGSAGDQIKVRNIDSGTTFSGTVMADGTIRVGAT
ncbi:flagellar basal body P-ring formation protein FlgA [Mesorhizobium sp. NBSH29]|uniref:flagellar basal body P-ring formation chaperone FlgA n=1 Tax=Mesorhizobium sp. NBSH29 TaxID=2654249 RepID=UPI0018965419|nr:flagellar basal body P-ring formation chaperone FlgA [Mesorhizobium sp. NBSH29]QPC85389.1 flagellar basal body P-ring formation protein FlgA [Mesorhizobium sp. NBSH29]